MTCIQNIQNESPAQIAIPVQTILEKVQPCTSSNSKIFIDKENETDEEILDEIEQDHETKTNPFN